MIRILGLFIISLFGLTACQLGLGDSLPTRASEAPTVTPSPIPADTEEPATVPPTWTPDPLGTQERPTLASGPTITPMPTNTPFPTRTPTPLPTSTPTNTPEATSTPLPTATAEVSGVNLLPNPSFEEGWYHVSGYVELQIPQDWTLGWKEEKNPLDPEPFNRFVRPESRLLTGDFLPADEHELFIWDGDYTVKVFKGQGALYFWLVTNVYLQPGSYIFIINVFPDMVEKYSRHGGKIWAPDPLSGELRFILDNEVDNWILPRFGEKQQFHYAFEVTEPRMVRLGAAFRGRWAIQNNGWFFDDWSLTQLSAYTGEGQGSE